ncbi:wall-associated receptor kinase-like 14 [Andrographis paniculata]|uniref:wall-associated receptor kinase-like 14 n=1 Tax=Andrographis paniculata TaxID=175694 RepID=UPI0021E8BA97|nr:wall-associated receptor kinase-like 14 [Andrographis paniculata]
MFARVRRFIIVLGFGLLALTSLAAAACNRTCGSSPVPFPFGFTEGCAIRLNCTRDLNLMKIGEFTVLNLTSDRILVSVPPNCTRSIEDLSSLIGTNYSPTVNNALLLDHCVRPINDCLFPDRLLKRLGIGVDGCIDSTNNQTMSCYIGDTNDDSEFLDYKRMKTLNCSGLISSVMVGLIGNASVNTTVSASLDFRMMELKWWVNESFPCVSNANTIRHHVKNATQIRCECKVGYTGDGFADGEGCRQVNASAPAPQQLSPQRSSHGRITALIAGITVGASMLATLAAICYCIRRRTELLKSRLSAKRLISEAAGCSSVPYYPYKEIERATNGFSEKQRLGTGAYGTVYSGKLHNFEMVAIKKIKHRDHESVEQVMNEIKLLSSVSHPNLVRLLGCCIENGEQILVYEYMPNGTLSQHLQRERGPVLPWTIRLTIAAETAHAIAHLHSAINPPIYHRDIKSSNILLDYEFKSKVADFGLSRFGMADDSHVSTAPQGTPGYLDPQYHQNFHLSDKSDVYSFGVVLVEIITAMKVVDFSRPHSDINLAALATDRIGKGRVDEIIDPYLEPHRDAWTLSSVHKLAELAFRCLAFHRDMRPSMMEVADELEQIRLSGWAPMEENIHMGSSVASSCSSPYQGSETSFNNSTSKRTGLGSRRLIVPQRTVADELPVTDEMKDCSPVSVRDPWPSEQSSPSANSLLSNIVSHGFSDRQPD